LSNLEIIGFKNSSDSQIGLGLRPRPILAALGIFFIQLFPNWTACSPITYTNEEAQAVYYTVIKHSGHLGTLEKCGKHSPAARVFYISLVFPNARRVLPQCNTRLRLLYLLIIIKFPYNAHSYWLKQRALSENKERVDDGELAFEFVIRNFDKFDPN